MRIKRPKDPIKITHEQAEALISKVKKNELDKNDQKTLCQIIHMFMWLQFALRETKISLTKIKKLVFGQKSETRKKPQVDASGSSNDDKPSSNGQTLDDDKPPAGEKPPVPPTDPIEPSNVSPDKPKPRGHGRLGVADYTNAERIYCSHPDHQRGDTCPECSRGSLFCMKDAATEIRLCSQGLVQAIIYMLERYRCSACGAIFTAPMPNDVSTQKYDESAKVTLAIMHYYMGLPFKRIELYQQMLGVPLPDATQFELVETVADTAYRIYEQLKHNAADSRLAYHDDTTARILSMIQENQQSAPARKAIYTTAMVFEGAHPICLYVTGRQHAGENLDDIVDLRDEALEPIMQMSDGLAANQLKDNFSTWLNCLVHGRRNFVKIESVFPEECHYVIDTIGEIYHHEEQIKAQGFDDQERLEFHQKHSGPIMDKLKIVMQKQLDDDLVEENSQLGGAYKYMLKRWDRLTQFLVILGAPLDNNMAERAIKSMIRYRNNSLFFKNEHGAYIGDVIISLVETCRMNKENPEHYLIALMKNKQAVFANPNEWLPWNYKGTREMTESRSVNPPEIIRDHNRFRVAVPQQNM